MAPKFSDLSSLVLVDTLAALPMESVVRLARLGHERLQQTCSLKWVKHRMTDVSFGAVLRAQRTSDAVAAEFSTDSILIRLGGKVHLAYQDFMHAYEACWINIKRVHRILHLCVEYGTIMEPDRYVNAIAILKELPNCKYVSQTITTTFSIPSIIDQFPELVFDYRHYTWGYQVLHSAFYRPALLKGRHVVDVVLAVCEPADVSEAELDRVRKLATKNAKDVPFISEGVCETVWWSAPVNKSKLELS